MVVEGMEVAVIVVVDGSSEWQYIKNRTMVMDGSINIYLTASDRGFWLWGHCRCYWHITAVQGN
jgi:hypothetical protein